MNRSVLSRGLAVGLLSATLSAVVAAPAQAATTVSPTEDGVPPVVRESSVTIDVDRTAMIYYRGSSSAAFAPQSNVTVSLGIGGCVGDNPNGTNNSPRTIVEVTGPSGDVISSVTSPARALGLGALATSPTNKPLPDGAPSNSAYRGDFPESGAHHGLRTTLDLAGKPAGTYTVKTRNINKVKTGLFGACATGTPVSNGNGGFTNAAPVAGEQVQTQTFEYRPWQHTFTDVLGAGTVSLNTAPAETAFTIGAKRSPVLSGERYTQTAFALPTESSFALPTNPTACLTNLASCLPPTATACDPGAGCDPRLVVVSRDPRGSDTDNVKGVFDLETKAFVAYVSTGGSTRTLMSLGTDNDAVYDGVLGQLAAAAKAQGVDLMSILGTKVSVGDAKNRTSLSLLNGLQIDPDETEGGVQLSTDASVQAGVIVHVYSTLRLDGPACVRTSASSAAGDRRYTKGEPTGYDVTTVDGVPALPKLGALGALVGGPVHLVRGTFGSNALVNTASAVVGADTAPGAPNGSPLWVNPLSGGIHVEKPRTMEFIGTGTWSASEAPLGALGGCITIDLLLGTGVAVFDNPLSVGLKNLTDPVTQPSPEAAKLGQAVTDAVEQVTDGATTLPVVSDALTNLVGALPGV